MTEMNAYFTIFCAVITVIFLILFARRFWNTGFSKVTRICVCLIPVIAIIIGVFSISDAYKQLESQNQAYALKQQQKEEEIKQKEEEVNVTTINLVSFNTDADAFELGIVHYKESSYYVAYKILEDGGKDYFEINVNTTIYQTLTEDETAYYEVTENGLNETLSKKLYVPKNTIIKEYNDGGK